MEQPYITPEMAMATNGNGNPSPMNPKDPAGATNGAGRTTRPAAPAPSGQEDDPVGEEVD
jgi:hypothetical protein